MNVKSVILIVAALLFAGGTAFVASRLLGTHKPQQAQVQEQPGKKVLVAKGNLPAGTFIKEDDVSWQKWPVDGINDSYLVEGQADLGNVVGAVIRKGVVGGEPITEVKIARPGDRGFLAAVLTPGMRAISIEVNEPSSVAGLVFPGDRVDVLLNMEFVIVYLGPDGNEQTSQIKPKSSETVLENVRLLATDRNLNDIEGEPKKITTVTIEVTPKQAEMIKVAASMGQLALSLRGLGMPDGKAPGPTVASATAASSSFFAQHAADTRDGPEKDKPKSKSSTDSAEGDPAPERGDTYTFDTEVSRPLEELRHPNGKNNGIQIVRGQPGQPQPLIQNVTLQ